MLIVPQRKPFPGYGSVDALRAAHSRFRPLIVSPHMDSQSLQILHCCTLATLRLFPRQALATAEGLVNRRSRLTSRRVGSVRLRDPACLRTALLHPRPRAAHRLRPQEAHDCDQLCPCPSLTRKGK